MIKSFVIFLIIMITSNVAVADSISITLKPIKGLSGTASLNIHNDRKVTMLVYESPAKVNETTIKIELEKVEELRNLALTTLNDYIKTDNFKGIKKYPFTMSVAHTNNGVTKNISSKRISQKALTLIKQVVTIKPDLKLKYVTDEI